MKVLIVTGSFPPMKCGVGDYSFQLAKHLSLQRNIRVAVLTGSSAEDIDGRIEVLPLVNGWGVLSLRKTLRVILEWGPDIVHIQYPTAGYGRCMGIHFLPILLLLFNVRFLQTWHEPLSWKGCIRYLPNVLIGRWLIVVESEYNCLIPFWYRFLLRQKRMIHIPVGSNIPFSPMMEFERSEVKGRFSATSARLVTYFGFVSPAKGVDQIFNICDPKNDVIVLICDLSDQDAYHETILEKVESARWRGKVFVTGFLPPKEVASILASSDVAIFPFVNGATERNASILAARCQGTPVVTTSTKSAGFFPEQNIYFAEPFDVEEMRIGLNECAGKRDLNPENTVCPWGFIATRHILAYEEVLDG